MQSRVLVRPGVRTTETRPNRNVQPVTTSAATDVWREQLFVTNPGVVNGNRRSPNPIEFSKAIYLYMNGRTITDEPDGGYTIVTGSLAEIPATPPSGFPDNQNRLYNEALGQVYDQIRGHVDLAVEIAQMGQTAGMFRAATKLANYLRSFTPKRWGEKWLEYQYGWRPLVQTLYDCANNVVVSTPSLMQVKGRAKEKTWLAGSAPYGIDVQKYRYFWRERVLIGTRWQVNPSVLLSIGNWSSLNPSAIVWELVPYSFVVDWFFNIGDYLRNLESAMLLNSMYVDGYWTYGYVMSGESVADFSKTSGSNLITVKRWGYRYNSYKKRTVLGSIPYPRTPRFEAHLGWQRILSAAALLDTYLRRR